MEFGLSGDQSYWRDDYLLSPNLSSLNLPEKVDVAIVGAGYTGLNAARILAKNKSSVVVFDQDHIGYGASGRNFGSLAVSPPLAYSKLCKNYGNSFADKIWDLYLDSNTVLSGVLAEENIDCDFKINGHIKLASKRKHAEKFKDEVRFLEKKLKDSVYFLSSTDLKNEINSEAFYGGVLDTKNGTLHPTKYLAGLAKSVISYGGSIKEDCAVSHLRRTAQGFDVIHSYGVTRAKEVILAKNGYTGKLLPSLQKKLFPIQSYILATEPLPSDLYQILALNKRVFTTSFVHKNYFRMVEGNRLLFGGRCGLRIGLKQHEYLSELRRHLLSIFPELENVKITHCWSGNMGFTFDLMPHIGNLNGVYYAGGYCGRGISMSTYCGVELGRMLLGHKSSSLLTELEHPSVPLYRGNPWFLPIVSKYLKFKDLFF